MSFPLLGTPKPQFFDSSGSPLVSGTLSILDPADDTNKASYPTYDDAEALTNANVNPIVLDSRGEPSSGLFGLDGESYKLVLKDSAGATVWTTDDVFLPQTRDSINVKDYGAKGDNSTDDTTALAAALAVGGDVYFPAGTYLISSSLDVADYTTVRAVGRAIISGFGGFTTAAFSTAGSTGLTFDGLEFSAFDECFDCNTPTDLTIRNCRIINGQIGTISNATRCKILHNYVSGRVNIMGIAMHGGSDIIVDGNHVVNAGDNGIAVRALTSNLTRVTITNNQIDNAGKSGIKCRVESSSTAGSTVKDAVVANNIINGWGSDEAGNGIDVPNVLSSTFNERIVVSDNVINSSGVVTKEITYISAQQCNNSTISGNACMGGVGISGITIQAAEYVTVTGNQIDGACQDNTHGSIALVGGITLSTSDYSTITGNSIKNTGSTTTPRPGIFMRTSTYNSLTGNVIFDSLGTTMSYGIEHVVAGTPDTNFNVIVGNNISGAVTQAISFDTGRQSTIATHNLGSVNEALGTGSILSASTTDVITHGLDFTPTASDISITLTENPTNTPGAIWVDTITSTQFTVNCENDPGASNLDFSWKAAIL